MKLHSGQRYGNGAAHSPQNFMPSEFSVLQAGQRIGRVYHSPGTETHYLA